MLKMAIKTFFIGLIILFNCQQLLASAVGNGNMLSATGKFYVKAISLMEYENPINLRGDCYEIGVHYKTPSSMANSFKEGNYVISPLAMAILDYVFYTAANNETRKQYEEYYFYMKNVDEIFEALQLSSFDISKQVHDLSSPQPARRIVDVGATVILDKKFKGRPDINKFSAFIKDNFLSVVSFSDLARNSEAARQKINEWVEEFTLGQIRNILPSMNPGCKLVGASALYLRANWIHSFYFINSLQTFHALKEGRTEEQQVRFITMSDFARGTYDAYRYGFVTAIRIPLRQKRMAMIIYMPDPQKFSTFLEDWSRDNDLLDRIVTRSLRKRQGARYIIGVAMPIFTIPAPSESLNLIAVHQHFGLTSLFDSFVPSLKFCDDFGIQTVNTYAHKAMIIVDQVGIEGDSTNLGKVTPSSYIQSEDQYLHIEINRPFLFQIVGYPDQGEGKMVYFTGQVTDAELAQQ